jgi:nucleoside-diphosphate-sugar epimerase
MWLIMAAIAMRFCARAFQKIFENFVRGDRKNQHNLPLSATQPHASFSPAPQARDTRKIIVTGATSLIGDYLIPKLLEAGFHVHALSRNPPSYSPTARVEWHKADISTHAMAGELGAEALIHLAPLSTLNAFLEHLNERSLNRIIAFSSTSRFTKQDSSHESERQMVLRLVDAENRLAEFSGRTGIRWTIFRPTLVYHLGRDKNITTIAYFIRRLGIFPLVGNGNGLRQPVHAEDLANACLSALDNPNTYNKTYNLSGAETLTYREMVLRLASKLERPCKIIHIPLPLLRWVLEILSYSSKYRHLTPEMANRINLDMCFDHLSANRDFGFSPRRFMENSWVSGHPTS